VLDELEVHDVPTILAFNKIDKFEDHVWFEDLKNSFADSVCISAKTGEGLNELNELIEHKLAALIVEIDVLIPITRMDLVNLVHEEGQVFSVKYYNDRINLRASVPTKIAGKIMSASI